MDPVWLPGCGVECNHVRVYKVRLGLQKKNQAVLIIATKLYFTKESPAVQALALSSWRTRAKVSTELQAMRSTGLTVAEREESFTRTESVAKWSREGWAAYKAAGTSAVRYSRVLQSCGIKYIRGDGDYFSYSNYRFGLILIFLAASCRAVISLSYIYEEVCPTVRTRMRRPG